MVFRKCLVACIVALSSGNLTWYSRKSCSGCGVLSGISTYDKFRFNVYARGINVNEKSRWLISVYWEF